jgi:hypothetical protein
MQIKMIGDFSYDLVPGQSRRTLHDGLVLDEPADVALAAINAGKAMRWPPAAAAPAPEAIEPAEGGGTDDGAGQTAETTPARKGSGKKPAAAKPAPAAEPAGTPAPAEAIEPGGDDDAGDDQAGADA